MLIEDKAALFELYFEEGLLGSLLFSPLSIIRFLGS